MEATFVICLHTQRIDNLLQTIRFLIDDHLEVVENSALEVLFQDSYGDLNKNNYEELESLREKFEKSCISSYELNQMRLPFLTNEGVKDADTEKIIILESDRILAKGYFAKVLSELKPGVQITCQSIMKCTAAFSDEEIKNGNFTYKWDIRSKTNEIGRKNIWSGNTAICKSDYMRVGMMDEEYNGYGWADSDMTKVTENANIQSVFVSDPKFNEVHLWHPPLTYGVGDQKQLFIDNGLKFCKKWNVEMPDWFRKEIADHNRVIL